MILTLVTVSHKVGVLLVKPHSVVLLFCCLTSSRVRDAVAVRLTELSWLHSVVYFGLILSFALQLWLNRHYLFKPNTNKLQKWGITKVKDRNVWGFAAVDMLPEFSALCVFCWSFTSFFTGSNTKALLCCSRLCCVALAHSLLCEMV